MALALIEPSGGYYANRDPLGAAGDFITAPEISQMFGELLGLWVASLRHEVGLSGAFRLVELGPGRGTLLSDALRALTSQPSLGEGLEIHLVEASPTLHAVQEQTLAPWRAQFPISWHRDFSTVPEGPMALIANEFFDVLPIRQYQMTPQGWAERLIGLAPNGDDFAFHLSAPSPLNALRIPERLRAAKEGEIAEVSSPALSITSEIARRLSEAPGGALIIDYGPAKTCLGSTFQAVKSHKRHDPLVAPGSADLTAHVDFQSLGEAAHAEGASVFGPLTQGEFLARIGIQARAARLSEKSSEQQRSDIASALKRLTDEGEMGTLFKVLALTSPGLSVAPGFSPDEVVR
jgi:NADH dehydrogenase [ubiquinone] 1 alpha subcomplex assembly factor 7